MALYLVKNERAGSFAEYSDGLSGAAADRQRYEETAPRGLGRLDRSPRHGKRRDGVEPGGHGPGRQSSRSSASGLLYVAGFGCVRHPAMALVALLVPMGWSFGYILMTVGHLNILSSAFATIVIGLGSDYGVYHIAQYLRYRAEKMSTFDALLATTRSIGPGADHQRRRYCGRLLFDRNERFSGHRRVGHHCRRRNLALLAGRPHDAARHDPLVRRPAAALAGPAPLDVYAWCRPLVNRPKVVVAGYAVFTLLICLGLKELWYDHNLLNLQAEGLESVKLEKKLLQSDCGASFAVVMAKSRQELLQRKSMYVNPELCPMVDSVEEIGSYVAENVTNKQPVIQHIHDQLAGLPPQMPEDRAHSGRAAGPVGPVAGKAARPDDGPAEGTGSPAVATHSQTSCRAFRHRSTTGA